MPQMPTRLLPVHTLRSAPPAGRSCLIAALPLGHRAARTNAHGLDAVVAHRLHTYRVTVGADGVAAPRQAAELGQDEAAHAVVGVRVPGTVSSLLDDVRHADPAPAHPRP